MSRHGGRYQYVNAGSYCLTAVYVSCVGDSNQGTHHDRRTCLSYGAALSLAPRTLADLPTFPAASTPDYDANLHSYGTSCRTHNSMIWGDILITLSSLCEFDWPVSQSLRPWQRLESVFYSESAAYVVCL